MDLTHAQVPAELVFPPQAAFSWTLRWARAHRSGSAGPKLRRYRIAGSARSGEQLAAAIAFARENGARLELD